jgi:FAD/FMN-containing dehydrogenase
LSPRPCVILDAPREVKEKIDVWAIPEGPELELMRRLKSSFDPAGVCNPGLFAGGI